MSNIVLERIKKQIPSSHSVIEIKQEPVRIENVSKPISPEDLKSIFMSELNPAPASNPQNGEMNFDSLVAFVDWFAPLQDQFTENQRVPLSTLIGMRNMIDVGCGCKRAQRANQAADYYKTFWINNINTDLPQKVLEVGGFTKVIFSRGPDDIFLIFPPDTQQ